MRPASKMFLVIALILMIGGGVLCAVGRHMAAEDGQALFAQTVGEDGRSVMTFSLDHEMISKLSIDVDHADIRVIGGSERSYAELFDFNPANTSCDVQNRILRIHTGWDFFTFFKIGGSGIAFDGLRDYIRTPFFSERREIVIHLSDEESVRVLEIGTETGSLTLEGIGSESDFLLKTDAGSITARDLANASFFSADCGEGDVTLEEVNADRYEITVELGHLTASLPADTAFDLRADLGSVTLNGESKGSAYQSEGDQSRAFQANVAVGDIALSLK